MPTRDTPWPDGTPCWVDYGAVDLEAARSFYGDLFGWQFTGGDEQYGGYLNATSGERLVAGLGPRMEESAPVAWTTYFATGDSEAAAGRITAAGGTVVLPPMDVEPYGRMTIALDPQGNGFGLWEAREHTGFQRYNEPGSVTWNEAAADDPDAARAFYAAVFDFTYDDVPEAGGYTTFRTEDRTPEHPLGGLGAVFPEAPRGWTVCFAVTSTDGAVAAVESAGGKTVMAPEDSSFGRFAVVTDPWGAAFSVLQDTSG